MFSKHAKIDRIIDPILVTSACACVLCVLCVLCVCCVCVCVYFASSRGKQYSTKPENNNSDSDPQATSFLRLPRSEERFVTFPDSWRTPSPASVASPVPPTNNLPLRRAKHPHSTHSPWQGSLARASEGRGCHEQLA